jgi:hypothetical protein
VARNLAPPNASKDLDNIVNDDTELIGFTYNIKPVQILTTPVYNEQVENDVSKWKSVNNPSPTQVNRITTSQLLYGTISNDSITDQRLTESIGLLISHLRRHKPV